MNRVFQTAVWFLVLPMLVATRAAVAEQQETPSGSIVIDETQIMWIVGGDIGGGTLHFQDKDYKFKTGGLKVGGFGATKVKLKGDVYHLNDVADFPGLYGVAEAGAVAAKVGKGDFVMKNDKGVVLHLKAHDTGLALDLGVEGMDIKME